MFGGSSALAHLLTRSRARPLDRVGNVGNRRGRAARRRLVRSGLPSGGLVSFELLERAISDDVVGGCGRPPPGGPLLGFLGVLAPRRCSGVGAGRELSDGAQLKPRGLQFCHHAGGAFVLLTIEALRGGGCFGCGLNGGFVLERSLD